MIRIIFHSVIIAILVVVLIPSTVIAKETVKLTDDQKLTNIVDTLSINPIESEKQLQLLKNKPLAKMLLAYLYMSDKVKIDDKEVVANELMKESIGEIIKAEPNSNLASAGYAEKIPEFKSVDDILGAIRFVIPHIPLWLVKEYPLLTFETLIAPNFACSRDSSLPYIKFDKNTKNIRDIKSIDSLLFYTSQTFAATMNLINCGTMRFMYIRALNNTFARASLDPDYFLKIAPPELEATEPGATKKTWDEAWKTMIKNPKFKGMYYKAANDLSKYYVDKFEMDPDKARKSANNALSYILIWYFYNKDYCAVI